MKLFAFRLFVDILKTGSESKSAQTVDEKQCKEEELQELEKNKIIVDDEDVTVVLEKNNDNLKNESPSCEKNKEETCNGTKEGKYLLYCLVQSSLQGSQ